MIWPRLLIPEVSASLQRSVFTSQCRTRIEIFQILARSRAVLGAWGRRTQYWEIQTGSPHIQIFFFSQSNKMCMGSMCLENNLQLRQPLFMEGVYWTQSHNHQIFFGGRERRGWLLLGIPSWATGWWDNLAKCTQPVARPPPGSQLRSPLSCTPPLSQFKSRA